MYIVKYIYNRHTDLVVMTISDLRNFKQRHLVFNWWLHYNIFYLYIVFSPGVFGMCAPISVPLLINIWFTTQRLNTYILWCILYAKGISQGRQATPSVKSNEMFKWKDDMKCQRYTSELVCAQGWSGQGTVLMTYLWR